MNERQGTVAGTSRAPLGARPRERRRDGRLAIHIPVHVQGHDAAGRPWEEMTTSEDISWGGAAFLLRQALTTGQVLLLSLPLPKRFRRYDLTSTSYRVYAVVRRIAGEYAPVRVSVLFLGQKPPAGYDQNPGGRYLMPSDRERRSAPRFEVSAPLRLRWESSGGPLEELTITENVGCEGFLVPTTLPLMREEVVELEQIGGPRRFRARVQHVFIGANNIPRLNLKVLDDPGRDWALETLRSAGIADPGTPAH